MEANGGEWRRMEAMEDIMEAIIESTIESIMGQYTTEVIEVSRGLQRGINLP